MAANVSPEKAEEIRKVYGETGSIRETARLVGVGRDTVRNHIAQVTHAPTIINPIQPVKHPEPKDFITNGRRHLVIPDTQIREGVPLYHISALGKYIVDKQPDVIVILGDWWDNPATSVWNTPKTQEGMRILNDIHSGNVALDMLVAPIEAYNKGRRNKYTPEKYFLFGNHEYHLERFVEQNPAIEGLVGNHLMNPSSRGFQVVPFKEVLEVDGVHYCHYFYNPKTGRPLGGTCHSKLNALKFSFVQGHVQEFDVARRDLQNGSVIRGLVAGAFYMHSEPYLGPQADHWRGCVMLNDVRDGDYALTEIQLGWLLKKYL